jgi:hypothetical protein
MTSKFFKIVIYGLLLIGCSTTKPRGSKELSSSVSSFPSTLKHAMAVEHRLGSKDVSYEYSLGIDTSLYPNELHL